MMIVTVMMVMPVINTLVIGLCGLHNQSRVTPRGNVSDTRKDALNLAMIRCHSNGTTSNQLLPIATNIVAHWLFLVSFASKIPIFSSHYGCQTLIP